MTQTDGWFRGSGKGVEHCRGGFGPDEGPWASVVLDDVAIDDRLKIDAAGERAPVQAPTGQAREEAFDGVEP